MRRRTIVWLGVVLAVATIATAVPGTDGNARAPWGRGWDADEHPGVERLREEHFERLTEFLDLSAQQVEQWRQAREGRAEAIEGGIDETRGLHEQIREMLSADKPDAAAIGGLVIEAHRGMEAARAEREAFHAELMTILTPEQRQRFEIMQELRPERGPRGIRGPRGFRGRGPRPFGSPEVG